MDACKSYCLESDPVSGDPWTERRRKLKSGLTFELCTDRTVASPPGKGVSDPCRSGSQRTDAVPAATAESLETRQLLSSTHLYGFPIGSRQGNGPRRHAMDSATLRSGALSVVGVDGTFSTGRPRIRPTRSRRSSSGAQSHPNAAGRHGSWHHRRVATSTSKTLT